MGHHSDIHLKSDPICSSAGCTQYLHPGEKTKDVIYPIYPEDKDITSTKKHIADQEAIHGTWSLPADPASLKKDKTNLQVENEVHQKSKVKVSSQTKADKAQQFAALREKMMSNWGTK